VTAEIHPIRVFVYRYCVLVSYSHMTTIICLSITAPQAAVHAYWRRSTRPDGRLWLTQARPTQCRLISHTNNEDVLSSAHVNIGHTHVLASISVQVGTPIRPVVHGRSPGDVTVRLTTSTTNNNDALFPVWESWLQRTWRDSIDLYALSVRPGRSAYGLMIAIYVLQDDGNVRDAALLASGMALAHMPWPPVTTNSRTSAESDNNDRVWMHPPQSTKTTRGYTTLLPVLPMALSLAWWQGQWIVDPTRDEQASSEGGMVLVCNGKSPACELLSWEVGVEQGTVTPTDFAVACRMVQARARELVACLVPNEPDSTPE
jgi:exosome complex RNA-binding protein Rrp42 (RNase PH superfamily)